MSGSWLSVTSSSAATMPQPMSTPTALGMTAPLVGMTEPTVAPMPTWASGMRATWPVDDGQPGGLLGLADGARVDVAGPGDELVVDCGGHVTPSFVS